MRSWLASTYLLALGAGALLFAGMAWESVTGYETGYAIEAELPAGTPLVERAVLIVVDGLREDAAAKLGAWQDLVRRGASGVAETVLPSLSAPSRVSLATGATVEVHGVTNNGRYSPPPVDSLFSLASRTKLPRAVYGSRIWERAFGARTLGEFQEFEKELYGYRDTEALLAWQRGICNGMVPFLERHARGLLVAGLTAPDEAGHDFGGESAEYREVLEEAGRCLDRLVRALDDGRTAFVAVSDHGHIHRRGRGGHGGAEPEVVRAPAVLAGAAIRRGVRLEGRQIDIAPTLAALLGLPLPANNQGRILWEALDVPGEARAALEDRERRQQELLRERLPGRAEGLAREKRERLAASAAAATVFLAMLAGGAFWLRREPVRLAAALALFAAGYAGLFWAFGLGYSLSAIVREEYLDSFFARNMAASALALVAAGAAVRGSWLPLALAVTSALGLRAVWIHYGEGLLVRNHLPDFDRAFEAYLHLLAMFAAGGAAVAATAVRAWRVRRHRAAQA